jgi:hypothetical protein
MSMPVRRGKAAAAAAVWTPSTSATIRARRARRARIGLALRLLFAALVAAVFFARGAPWAGAAVIGVAGVLAIAGAGALARVEHGVGLLLGLVLLTPIVLLFFVPMRLVARRGSRDRLARRIDPARPSYFRRRARPGSLDRPY